MRINKNEENLSQFAGAHQSRYQSIGMKIWNKLKERPRGSRLRDNHKEAPHQATTVLNTQGTGK